MKRKAEGKILLQGYEVGFILNELRETPGCIMSEVFDGGRSCLLIAGRSDNVDFKFEFKTEAAVKWLEEQDWILDYDEYVKKEPQELMDIHGKLVKDYNAKVKDYNSKDSDYRKNHFFDMVHLSDELQKLGHKIDSLGYMIYFLQHDHQWP